MLVLAYLDKSHKTHKSGDDKLIQAIFYTRKIQTFSKKLQNTGRPQKYKCRHLQLSLQVTHCINPTTQEKKLFNKAYTNLCERNDERRKHTIRMKYHTKYYHSHVEKKCRTK